MVIIMKIFKLLTEIFSNSDEIYIKNEDMQKLHIETSAFVDGDDIQNEIKKRLRSILLEFTKNINITGHGACFDKSLFIKEALLEYINMLPHADIIVKHIFSTNSIWQHILNDTYNTLPYKGLKNIFNTSIAMCKDIKGSAFEYFCTLKNTNIFIGSESFMAIWYFNQDVVSSNLIIEKLEMLRRISPNESKKNIGYILEMSVMNHKRFSDAVKILEYFFNNYIEECKGVYAQVLFGAARDGWVDGFSYMLHHHGVQNCLLDPIDELSGIMNTTLIESLAAVFLIQELSHCERSDEIKSHTEIQDLLLNFIKKYVDFDIDFFKNDERIKDIYDTYKSMLKEKRLDTIGKFTYLSKVSISELIKDVEFFNQEFPDNEHGYVAQRNYNVEGITFNNIADRDKFISQAANSDDICFVCKNSPLCVIHMKSSNVPDIIKEHLNKQNKEFVNNIQFVNRSTTQLTADKLPDSLDELMAMIGAIDYRSRSYNFFVHIASTDDTSLEGLQTSLSKGWPGFFEYTPYFSASIITEDTPPALMMHQGNILPPMGFILNNVNHAHIVYANNSDIFSMTDTQDDPQNILRGICRFLEKRKTMELVVDCLEKHAVKPEDLSLFRENIDLIFSHYFPNLLLPYDKTFELSMLSMPSVNYEHMPKLMNHSYYNEFVIFGNRMCPKKANMNIAGIAIEKDSLTHFLRRLKIDRSNERQNLIDSFNKVLALGLPIVVVNTSYDNIIEKTDAAGIEKRMDIMQSVESRLTMKTMGLYFSLEKHKKNKSSSTEIPEIKEEIGRLVKDLKKFGMENKRYIDSKKKAKL